MICSALAGEGLRVVEHLPLIPLMTVGQMGQMVLDLVMHFLH